MENSKKYVEGCFLKLIGGVILIPIAIGLFINTFPNASPDSLQGVVDVAAGILKMGKNLVEWGAINPLQCGVIAIAVFALLKGASQRLGKN